MASTSLCDDQKPYAPELRFTAVLTDSTRTVRFERVTPTYSYSVTNTQPLALSFSAIIDEEVPEVELALA